jgi:hypothetical protein
MTMSTPNSSRFRRQSVTRAKRGQHDTAQAFLEVVERLEKAVGSLSHLIAAHAQAVACMAPGGVSADVWGDVPSIEEIGEVFGLPRRGPARIVHALAQTGGDVIPDTKLCALIGCSIPTLKVYTSEARTALHDFGIERGISRERGRGYYMQPSVIASLTQLCSAARRGRGMYR